MQMLFEVPILLSNDLQVQAKEIDQLFKVYHDIEPMEVVSIFKKFPYLYCCPPRKIQLFLAHFRKYRFTKDQILNIVSGHSHVC